MAAEPAELAFDQWCRDHAARLEGALDGRLPPASREPARLHEAMRYAALGGGKRVRPLLVYAAGELAPAADPAALDAAACAVECIHAYSLVHDDLPCMDDDDLRRGRPTVHVAYDEATAMLVGDGLQAQAFVALGELDDACLPAALRILAAAAGSLGMVGGQAIDLSAVGRRLAADELERMHRMKTGALLQASVALGWVVGHRGAPLPPALADYADAVGLAFQVVDDILDVEADTATLGKTAGKDAEQDKPTYVSVLGLEPARALARELGERADAALETFGSRGARLRELADLIVRRSH
ncbi:MAG: polyprenyl synthetase family protein [Burkholderiaceae bacterium]